MPWGSFEISRYTDLINGAMDSLPIETMEDFELIQRGLQIVLQERAVPFPEKYKEQLADIQYMLNSPSEYVHPEYEDHYTDYKKIILTCIQARIRKLENKSESEKQEDILKYKAHLAKVKETSEIIKKRKEALEASEEAQGADRELRRVFSDNDEHVAVANIPNCMECIMSGDPEQMINALIYLEYVAKDNARIQTAIILQDRLGTLISCLEFEDENIVDYALEILLNFAQNGSFNQEEIYEGFALPFIEKWMDLEKNKATELFNSLYSNAAIRAQIDFLHNNQSEFAQLKEELDSDSTIIGALSKILERSDPDYLNAVRHIGGIGLIVKLFHVFNEDMKLLAIKTLGRLAHNNQHSQNTIRREMGIRPLMESLDQPALTESVLMALSEICENNQNNQISIYNYGIAPIVSLIDSEHHDKVMKLLKGLSGHQRIEARIKAVMEYKPLVDSLKDMDIERIKKGLTTTLDGLTNKRSGKNVQIVFCDANGIPALIKLLEQNDPDILRKTISIIIYLIHYNPNNALPIAYKNAIPLLIGLLNHQDKKITELAIVALGFLVKNSPDNQERLYQAQGVPVLLRLLNEKRPEIVRNALSALFYLSENNPTLRAAIVAEKGLVAIINALKNEDPEIRLVGCKSLYHYANDNPEYLDFIHDEPDIIPTLIKAATPDSISILDLLLRKNPDSLTLIRNEPTIIRTLKEVSTPASVDILSKLAKSDSKIRHALGETQTIAWLISCLSSPNVTMVETALKVVWEFMSNRENDILGIFRAQGGVSVLRGLVKDSGFVEACVVSILDYLASELIQENLYYRGLEEYGFILENFNQKDYILQHRGEVYEALGDFKNARKDYEAILQISPDHKAANERIQRLLDNQKIFDSLDTLRLNRDESAILSSLDTLAKITEEPAIPYHLIYFKVITSLVSLLSKGHEKKSLLAVKILFNLAKNNPDYQMVIYEAHVLPYLFSLDRSGNENHVEQLLVQLSSAPELKLAIKQAKSFTHFTITLNDFVHGFNKDDRELNEKIQEKLGEIEQLAKDNFSNQNALRDAGVIPAVVQFFIPSPDEKTSASAARTLAALAKDNSINQGVIVEADAMNDLILQLGNPLSASEAALALAYLLKNSPKNQEYIESFIPALINNLSSLKHAEGIQNTLLALAYAAQAYPENQNKIFSEGGMDAIIALSGSNNKDTADQANFALDCIMGNKDLIEYVLKRRGKVYEKLGNYGSALKDYERLLQIAPNTQGVSQTIQRLKVTKQIWDSLENVRLNNEPSTILVELNTLANLTEGNALSYNASNVKECIASLVSLLSSPDEEISLRAVKILFNLIKGNPDYQIKIFECGGIDAIIPLLGSKNKNIVHQAALALDAIMDNNFDAQKHVLHVVKIEPLKLLLRSEEVQIQETAKKILMSLVPMLLSKAKSREAEGELAEAQADYADVVDIFPDSAEAQEGLERTRESFRP